MEAATLDQTVTVSPSPRWGVLDHLDGGSGRQGAP